MFTKFNWDDLLHVSTAKCQDGGCLAQRIVPFNSDFLPGRTLLVLALVAHFSVVSM